MHKKITTSEIWADITRPSIAYTTVEYTKYRIIRHILKAMADLVNQSLEVAKTMSKEIIDLIIVSCYGSLIGLQMD